jgi:hypothetical protein
MPPDPKTLVTALLPIWVIAAIVAVAPMAHGGIELSASTVDVRLEDDGSDGNASVDVRNTGKATVKAARVTTSCGCTTATLNKTTLAPGEKSSMVITVKRNGSLGTYTKTVTIETDDAEHPKMELTVRITAVPLKATSQPAP